MFKNTRTFRKTLTILSALTIVGGLSSAAVASPNDWGVRIGFCRDGARVGVRLGDRRHRYDRYDRYRGHRGSDHRVHVPRRAQRHHHVRAPVYHKVWVAPVYQTVVVGHDHYGCPIYRRVCVRAGYYRSEISGYHCGTCNAPLH